MNADFVCEFYDVSMCDISVISKSLAWSVHNDKVVAPELDKIDMIKELLHVNTRTAEQLIYLQQPRASFDTSQLDKGSLRQDAVGLQCRGTAGRRLVPQHT